MVIIVQVLGKYMIIRYMDPQGLESDGQDKRKRHGNWAFVRSLGYPKP